MASSSSTSVDPDPLPWIEQRIAEGLSLTEPAISAATGASRQRVDSTMRFLNLLGHIIKDPDGPVSGDDVRWIRKPTS